MKEYPLKLENIGDHSYAIMSRGHQDKDAFMSLICKEYNHFLPMFPPDHLYFKATPMDGGVRYSEAPKTTRGAFPATFTQECHKDMAYQFVPFVSGEKIKEFTEEMKKIVGDKKI